MMDVASAQDVIGRKLHDVIHHSHPDGRPCVADDRPIYLAASQGVVKHVSEELFFPIHREPVWVEYWATPIVQDGVLQGAICTFQDISEQRHVGLGRIDATGETLVIDRDWAAGPLSSS